MKKILIIGNGGREHAIGKKIILDNPNVHLFFASGNGGTAQIGINITYKNSDDLVIFATENQIDITIVGSENLLMQGIVDAFQKNNLPILGPHQQAALLEGSKAFAKDFMQKYGVKTAHYQSFTAIEKALAYLENQKFPLVIKASGLAEGKGVIIAQNKAEATETIQNLMIHNQFGTAGNEVVIEEFLQGFEVSVLSFFNQKNIYPFVSAKDHKKIGEGETGLNTGGMGVIAPNPFYTETHQQLFEQHILQPTLNGLQAENLKFSGVIFFGLMITNDEVYLLEYNLRMGDPETQALLPLLNSNFLTLVEDCINQKELVFDWKNEHSCCVVLASGGYPLAYEKGFEITGLETLETPVFFAGIDTDLKTSGGRVLNVVATAKTLAEARKKAYTALEKINFKNKIFRTDIGEIYI